MSDPRGDSAALLEAGSAALREARWSDALAAFERAISGEESPEAYEGLSWAAWWLDDADAVFQARERAYRLYRQRDDAASAARMATWLAADHFDFRGAPAVAHGWLARAERLLEPLEPRADHGWLAFHEGFVANLTGETERADHLGAEAARLGRDLGVADLEMLGLALRGSTLVARARIPEGMRCLDEATAMALAGEATLPISCAWTCCFLVSACTAVLDFERASQWCDRIAEFSERYRSRYMLAFCRAEYGAVHLWRGRWRDAEELLAASAGDFARSRTAMKGAPLATLAELRRRQGRQQEAESLLDRAGGSSAAQLVRARIALDDRNAPRALEILQRVLRQLPADRELARVRVLELVVRAHAAGGAQQLATSALQELRAIQERVESAPMRASADCAAATVAVALGEHPRARMLLEDAVDVFERVGAPYEAARARMQLADALRALGQPGDAERQAAIAAASLRDLGSAARGPSSGAGATATADKRAAVAVVTPRERQVLGLLAEGLTNREIGDRLGLSDHTVHRHVSNILRKLDVPSRAAAAAHAARAGLLEPEGR